MTSPIVITLGKSALLHINYVPCQCLVSVLSPVFGLSNNKVGIRGATT